MYKHALLSVCIGSKHIWSGIVIARLCTMHAIDETGSVRSALRRLRLELRWVIQ